MHWNSEWAKHTFEACIYKRYNKQYPVTIWDTSDKTVYFGNQPQRISFTSQTSDMEREVKVKLAMRVADNAAIFNYFETRKIPSTCTFTSTTTTSTSSMTTGCRDGRKPTPKLSILNVDITHTC